MATEPDFGMLIESPDAYRAHAKGFGKAIAAGATAAEAAEFCGLSQEEMAGAFGLLKKAGRAAGRTGQGIGRGVARGAKLAVKVNPTYLTLKYAGKGLGFATGPIRRKIFRAFFGKLIGRRARLLAWTRRGSLQPVPSEQQAARSWAVAYVKRRGAFGKVLGTALSGDTVGEPVSTALITASIPVLIELARRALKTAEHEGAPADPRTVAAPPEASPEQQPENNAEDHNPQE